MKEWTMPAFSCRLDQRLKEMRWEYKKNGVPVILDDSLNLLLTFVAVKSPKRILEIGTATGMSGIAMLQSAPDSRLVTIEQDEERYYSAKKNFYDFNLADRVTAHLGDAGEIIGYLGGSFDFIFLDGAKARYYDYLPELKRLLNAGGVLFADNVLFRGLVESKNPPHSDMTIVRNMRAFLDDLALDLAFNTQLFRVGDGVAVARKI